MPPPLARTLIVTDRLLLVASEPGMTLAVRDFQRRNRRHFAPWDPPTAEVFFTEDFQRERLHQAAEAFAADTAWRWWLVPQDQPGMVIGSVHVSQVSRGAFQSAMLGYALDAAAQGHGLMHEALQATLDEVFGPIVNLHRLQANHRPENLRSAAVLQRLGFHREGVAPQYLFIDGAWRDHVVNAKLNPSFRRPSGW
jgi:ribosomal-protein-alanine N-acetyltransferase